MIGQVREQAECQSLAVVRSAASGIEIPDMVAFLWSNAERVSDGCLIWLRGRGRLDYGFLTTKVFVYGKRETLAHRLSWTLANGPIPSGAVIAHRCDTPPCIEPTHLFCGSPADNHADMVAKNRQAKGEATNRARFTEAEVVAIRARVDSGEQAKAVALSLGCAEGTIHYIKHRRTWRHVPEAALSVPA